MFERFTDRARRVVVLAQDEARRLEHDYIGTEHLLLGLIREGDGVANRALAALGVTESAVRAEVERIIGRGQHAPRGHIPFTPRAKKVLELSLREALQMGHNYIGTEHILLGLIREGEGVAAEVLRELGAELERVRRTVIQLLSGYAATGTAGSEGVFTEYEGSHAAPESSFGSTVPTQDFPTCPACRASLQEWLRVRTLEAGTEDEETRSVTLAYCGHCGSTLQVVP